MEITKGSGLDGAAKVEVEFFDAVGKVRDEDFANFIWAGLIENKAEGPLGVVLADKNDRAVEEGAAELAAVQEQLATKRLEFISHTGSERMCIIAGPLTRSCLIAG